MASNPAISSLLSISFLFSLFILTNSQCSDLTSNGSTACELDGYCSWNTDSNCVCGQTSWDQDIAFIFDSSMTELDWFYTTKFAAELLYYGSPSDTTTRAAIITTGTSTIDPTIDLSFADNEALSDTITTTLPDLSQVTQADLYLEEALQSALDLFNASSSSSTRKILIVFASELSAQASIPCRVNTRKHEVYTYTITMGSWDPYAFLCVGSSENNYEGLQSVSDASQLTDVLLPVLEAITCPHHPLLKVTEIQLEGALGEQYFEIYNYGHDITDMSQIELSGIASGALSAGATLSQGAIGVIYNTDTAIAKAAVPDCASCSCDEDTNTVSEASIKWCDSAVYYGCCSDCSDNYAAFENIVSSCVWDTGLSMASFDLGLVWTNAMTATQFTVDSLTVNTTASEEMPTMEINYALELINKGYNNKFASSWSMSCDADGTPGDDYLAVECGYDCTIDGNITCDLNGGMWLDVADPVPGCVFSAQSCNCLAGFYPHYRTCLRLPTPRSCLDVQVTTAASDVSFIVAEWDGDTRYTYSHCEDVDGCLGSIGYSTSTVNSLRFRINSPGRSTNNTRISLSAISPHDDSYEWLGFDIKCNATTADPTVSPTPSPTFSVPTVPSCSITLAADMKKFVITWDPIDMQQFNGTAADMEHFAGYVYYFNTFRRNGAAPASCCNVSGLVPNSATFDLFSDTIAVSGDWDSTLTDVDQGKEYTSGTLCSVMTQVPTSSPSKSPSDEPTPGPTEVPSAAPTLSPTQKELYIASCAAVVLPGGTSLSMSWNAAEFGSDTASINDTEYIIEWFYSNGRTPGFEMIPANQGARGIDVVDYLNVTNLQMHCVWDSWTQIGRKTNCTITTYAPSAAPTDNPSSDPTSDPTQEPTFIPSINPSVEPTQAPTYGYGDVSWCHAVIGHSFGLVTIKLLWGLLDVNDSESVYPLSETISYVGIIGSAPNTNEIRAKHTSAFIQCNETKPNDCWGQASKSLSSNTGLDIDVSQVTFYAEYDMIDSLHATDIISCSIDTPFPTLAPSIDPTKSPTLSPTLGGVWVQLDNTQCEQERCGCISSSFSENPDCCYNACDWDRMPAPLYIVQEKEKSNTTFYVRRNIVEYPYLVEIKYNITVVTNEVASKYGFYTRMREIEEKIEAGNYTVNFETLNLGNVSNVTAAVNATASGYNLSYTIPHDCYFDEWDDKKCVHYIDDEIVTGPNYEWCSGGKKRENEKNTCSWCDFGRVAGPRCNDIMPNSGIIKIPRTDLSGISGATWQQAAFELDITIENCLDRCDWSGEVFLLELTSCNVIYNDEDLNTTELDKIGANPRDTMSCTVIYPSRAYILVKDADKINIITEEIIADTSYNKWLWYFIAGAVIILGVLSWIAYTWWKNKRMKEADVAEIEEEMEDVVLEQELGWQGDEEVNVAPINPLATVTAGIQRPVDSYGAEYNPNANQRLKDVAQVGVEKFDVKVEYGQQMGAQAADADADADIL